MRRGPATDPNMSSRDEPPQGDVVRPLGVLLIDDLPERRDSVSRVLTEAGYQIHASLGSASGLLAQLARYQPDLLIMELDSPDRDLLESLTLIAELHPTPILFNAVRADRELMTAAVRAGVCAYQSHGLDTERAQAAIALALAQFETFQSLRQQLKATQEQLESRKLVERAKGLLMAHQNLSEADAHALLRKVAMDQGVRLEQAAARVLNKLANSQGAKR